MRIRSDNYIMPVKLAAVRFLVGIAVISGCDTARSVTQTTNPPASRYVSQVWVADRGDGTYQNPIIHADYSDPDVIRVGTDYWMTGSSFHCMPGLPILHSKDLVNWRIVNHALPIQIPSEFFDRPQHGYGVWAPSIRYHRGEYFIFWGDPDHGIYMIKTTDPAGEWSVPHLVRAGRGLIDPCPLWDDSGQAYLVHAWAASRAGINSLLTMYRMSDDGMRLLDGGKHVYSGHERNKTIEGPKLYKRNGYYYIMAPAGGVATGWQLILRSKDIYGPYDEKIVLDQGNTDINGPHQGGYVETPGGQPWFIHFQDKEAYGRVVHLQPVAWKENWPVMGADADGDGKGQPVKIYEKPDVGKHPIATPGESDEFNSDTLGLQWQWQANPKITWSALIRNSGVLRLFAIPAPPDVSNLWPIPHLLMQKFPAPEFTATTKISLRLDSLAWEGKTAGLIVMGDDYATLKIFKRESGFYVAQVLCINAKNQSEERVQKEIPLRSDTAFLRVQVRAPDAICIFSYSEDGNTFHRIGEPFKAKPETWVGSKVGVFCIGSSQGRRGGYADVDWFRISK